MEKVFVREKEGRRDGRGRWKGGLEKCGGRVGGKKKIDWGGYCEGKVGGGEELCGEVTREAAEEAVKGGRVLGSLLLFSRESSVEKLSSTRLRFLRSFLRRKF